MKRERVEKLGNQGREVVDERDGEDKGLKRRLLLGKINRESDKMDE